MKVFVFCGVDYDLHAVEEDLKLLFGQFGIVHRLHVVTDKFTGASRGYPFLTMPFKDAVTAIQALNGTEFQGRTLRVEPAEDRRGWASTGRTADEQEKAKR